MAFGTARVSDSISHGGTIITGSSDTLTNSLQVARVTDTATCADPDHGIENIITGATTVITNGLQTARIGESLTCGATVVSGSSDRLIGDSTGSYTSPRVNRSMTMGHIVFDNGEVGDIGLADLAAWDDVELPPGDPRIGIVTYPLITDVRSPTSAEQQSTKDMGYNTEEDNNPSTRKVDERGEPPPPITGCSITNIDYDMKVGSYFKLSKVCSKAVVSPTRIKAQRGLTEQQIACNLELVVLNILDPLAAKYGAGKIGVTSGFRLGGTTSQHGLGQAVDIQFSDQWNDSLSKNAWWDRVMWVKDNINFDQLIVEYIGNRPWLHISFNRAGNRGSMLSTWVNGKYEKGLHLR